MRNQINERDALAFKQLKRMTVVNLIGPRAPSMLGLIEVILFL
jgi:hypothetical protein